MTTPTLGAVPSPQTTAAPAAIDPALVPGAPRWTTSTAYLDIIAARRGWTTETLAAMTAATDRLLDEIDPTVERLHAAILTGEVITVWPDYDVDGISAGTVLYAGLAELGANVRMIVPSYTGSRNMEPGDVNDIMTKHPETRVIITCDGGVNSHAGIDHARALGVTTIITDHHLEDPAQPCRADFHVNPNRVTSTYDHRDICGAQVAHRVLDRYARRFRTDKIEAVSLLRVFAGIGSLADVMPVTHANRADVKTALIYLTMLMPQFPRDRYDRIQTSAAHRAKPYSSVLMEIITSGNHHPWFTDAFKGLATVLNQLGFAKKIYDSDDLDESFIGYTLAPMFNATRRVEADMRINMAVFTPSVVIAHDRLTGHPGHDDWASPAAAVDTLIVNNEERKQRVRQLLAEIEGADQPMAPHIYIVPDHLDAPSGFLGLLANELLKSTDSAMTAVLKSTRSGGWSGSGRAADGASFMALSTPGVRCLGHAQACGVQIAPGTLPGTLYHDMAALSRDWTTTHGGGADTLISGADLSLIDIDDAVRTLLGTYDALLDIDKAADLVDDLDVLKPFGHGFQYPSILLTVDPAQCRVTTLGKEDKHMKITTPSGLTAIQWNANVRRNEHDAHETTAFDEFADMRLDNTRRAADGHPPVHAHLEVEFGLNVFGENTTVQAIIRSITYDR